MFLQFIIDVSGRVLLNTFWNSLMKKDVDIIKELKYLLLFHILDKSMVQPFC